ncbi:hypothetical protein LL067_15705 [Yersinia pseudotuberculosis]|uniref:ABC-three component system middle component 2 n=1 Tax=Yersinia TaxID=629 RepID=UPI0021BD065B|nr:ABC-three component system middle component 2 [Yersinia aleksiciae]
MITPINSHIQRPFNSPLECGLRMLFILAAKSKQGADLQRLVSYDYLLVHSGDVDGGPPSLHPDVPFRGNELLVKRDLIEAGLNQMFARELLKKSFTNYGIIYASSELTAAFINLLSSDYSNAIRGRSLWVINEFGHFNDTELNNYMSVNVGRWGTEFPRFTAARELEL